MQTEIVQSVIISEVGEISLRLASGGNSLYKNVYRAGAGVSWEQKTESFKFVAPKDKPYATWLAYMVKVVKDELGVDLVLSEQI